MSRPMILRSCRRLGILYPFHIESETPSPLTASELASEPILVGKLSSCFPTKYKGWHFDAGTPESVSDCAENIVEKI